MERSQFTFYRSYYEAIKSLPPKLLSEVVLSVCAYALDGEDPTLSGASLSMFALIKPTLDASRCKAENGKRGGRPKQDEPNEKQNKPNRKQIEPNSQNIKPKIENKKEKENEIENECYISPKPSSSSSEKAKRFLPPSLEEVTAFVRERNSPVDPQEFLDFYAAKGWLVGKTPMKDWRAACRNAEHWDRWQTAKPPSAIQDARPYRNRPPCQTHDAELSEFEQDAIDKMMKRGKYADV